ncbi:MAG: hypothetical protein ACHQ4G_02690 [Opitutales bacterium]
MLFSAKLKGFYVEHGADTVLIARTSAAAVPLVVEDMRECAANDPAALAEAIKQLQSKRSPSGYLHACCGVYPAKRLIRRTSLEVKRVKDPTYFPEILTQQFRVEPEKYTTIVLNAGDGAEFDPNRPAPQKEVIIAGMPSDEVLSIQDKLLEGEIYPERLELGSIALLGALVDYLAFKKEKTPVLVLEIGADVTHAYIVSSAGVEASRPIPQGIEAMVPVVQKELGLKDEASARKLFYSESFDFASMGPALVRRLLKELQSYIGFYEVQTGQSVGLLLNALLPANMAWLDGAIASSLGVAPLKLELASWLQSRQITLADPVQKTMQTRGFGLLSLMVNYNAATPAPHGVAEKKA